MTDGDERILKPKSGTVNPFWTDEEIMLLEQNYSKAQISPSDMEAIFGRRWSAIREKARSLGFRRSRLNYKEWTSKEISLLEQLYPNAHIAPTEMENIFERRWETIAQTAQNIGLRRARDLYTINRSYFRDVRTEKQSYWLGLLASDGNVSNNSVVLELSNKDRILVERFRDDIAPYSPIYEKSRNNSCRIQIASKEMCIDLDRYNVVPNKSSIFIWPTALPDNLAMSFLLGYFDGDGSLFYYERKSYKYWRWLLVGTQPFLIVARHYIQHYAQVEIKAPSRCHKHISPHLYMLKSDNQKTVTRIDQALNMSRLGLARKHFQL